MCNLNIYSKICFIRKIMGAIKKITDEAEGLNNSISRRQL